MENLELSISKLSLENRNYSQNEIAKIIKIQILPNILENMGLRRNDCEITDAACMSLSSLLSREIKEYGIKSLEREIRKILSAICIINCSEKKDNVLRDFKGFPYRINTETIIRLWSNRKISTDYLNMYM